LPSGLTGLAGIACAACCAIPLLLAAGVLSGAGWALATAWLPGIAVVLTALAAAAWWTARRSHRTGCGGGSCGCAAR
jgi:mercuric ion transport protein